MIATGAPALKVTGAGGTWVGVIAFEITKFAIPGNAGIQNFQGAADFGRRRRFRGWPDDICRISDHCIPAFAG